MATADDFRRLALGLDGAEERSHMGAPDFRVGGRIFATLASEAQGYGNLVLTPEVQATFVGGGARDLRADRRWLGTHGHDAHLPRRGRRGDRCGRASHRVEAPRREERAGRAPPAATNVIPARVVWSGEASCSATCRKSRRLNPSVEQMNLAVGVQGVAAGRG